MGYYKKHSDRSSINGSEKKKTNKALVPGEEWITAEVGYMIEKWRKFKIGTTLEYKWKYEKLRNFVKRKSKEAKEKSKDIKKQMRTDSGDAAYKSNFFIDYKPKRGALEDNNGVIIYEDKHKGSIMERKSRTVICGVRTHWTRNRT